MMKLAMSPAAASLLRALLNRAGVDRTQVLLGKFTSVDWQSLTFVGERHEIDLRITGPNPSRIAARLSDQIGLAEFDVAGHVVADIHLATSPTVLRDGSVSLSIEALTIEE